MPPESKTRSLICLHLPPPLPPLRALALRCRIVRQNDHHHHRKQLVCLGRALEFATRCFWRTCRRARHFDGSPSNLGARKKLVSVPLSLARSLPVRFVSTTSEGERERKRLTPLRTNSLTATASMCTSIARRRCQRRHVVSGPRSSPAERASRAIGLAPHTWLCVRE